MKSSERMHERPAAPVKRCSSGRAVGSRVDVGGVLVSHPDRVLEPLAVTKLHLARYFAEIGARMLPHVRGRPLSLVRWSEEPTDRGGIFLRHAKAWGPAELRRVRIQEKTKWGDYLVVDHPPALVALAQWDILEIHTWNSTTDDLERPDRVVIDLDPGPDVAWAETIRAAREIKERLAAMRLESWVKTTGGKGLHVVVPLLPRAGWEEVADFARGFASALAAQDPTRFVATMAKDRRAGRVFVDYLRNHRANTSIAAFSTRSRRGGPVSVPLLWEELGDVDPASFTTTAVLDRVRKQRRDPWEGYWGAEQVLPRA
jgi:bifunctional non-homologous end joining protein LigD